MLGPSRRADRPHMERAPKLPPAAKKILADYVIEKSRGAYGHNDSTRKRFIAQLDKSGFPRINTKALQSASEMLAGDRPVQLTEQTRQAWAVPLGPQQSPANRWTGFNFARRSATDGRAQHNARALSHQEYGGSPTLRLFALPELSRATPGAHPRAADCRAPPGVASPALADASAVAPLEGAHSARRVETIGIEVALSAGVRQACDPYQGANRNHDFEFCVHRSPSTIWPRCQLPRQVSYGAARRMLNALIPGTNWLSAKASGGTALTF